MYNIDQKDLAKVSVILQCEPIWELLDEKFNLPAGTTQYYCESRLAFFSDPDWYENYEGYDNYPEMSMYECIVALNDWDGEDFLDEMYHDRPFMDEEFNKMLDKINEPEARDVYWSLRRMPEKVLDMCINALEH